VAGNGSWLSTANAALLYDTDLQGSSLRKFYYANSVDDELFGVSFIGRDRIVVGTTRISTDLVYQIWVARIRSP
jgi:hypothetical protein